METTQETAEALAQRSRVTIEEDPLAIAARGGALPSLREGDVVGRYRIVRELGRGGAGVVFAAFDPRRGHEVALKLTPESASEEQRAALVREAEALAAIEHPNVVAVHEVGTTESGLTFLAMQLVTGPTLRAWLAEPRTIAEIRRVFAHAGRGLLAAHALGLVHGDFKPDNVMLDGERVMVLDFGLAQLAGRVANGGTRIYMAPELLWNLSPSSLRSDQFSFCVALWEALYGERPFDRHDLHAGPPVPASKREGGRIPASLRRALVRGLSVDPQRRFESLQPIVDALERRRLFARR